MHVNKIIIQKCEMNYVILILNVKVIVITIIIHVWMHIINKKIIMLYFITKRKGNATYENECSVVFCSNTHSLSVGIKRKCEQIIGQKCIHLVILRKIHVDKNKLNWQEYE